MSSRERKKGKGKYLPSLQRCLGFGCLVQSPETKKALSASSLHLPKLRLAIETETGNSTKHESQVTHVTPQVLFDLGFLHACHFCCWDEERYDALSVGTEDYKSR